MSWLVFVILIAATWRITRFIVLDDLIEGTRDKVLGFLSKEREAGRRDFIANKLWMLLTCPWCVGVWCAAGVLITARIFCLDSIPMPIFTWLAVAALQLIPYNYLDGK